MDDPDLMFDFLSGTHSMTTLPQNHITSSTAVASTVQQSSSLFDDLMHSNVFADFSSSNVERHNQEEYSEEGGDFSATESHTPGLSLNNVHTDADSFQAETDVSKETQQTDVKSELVNQATAADSDAYEQWPAIDIIIQNVVSSFSTRCHLNLKTLANKSRNVIYKRQQSVSNLL